MQSLNNYLRTYRRKAGLSQEELAQLLGSESGTTISRHEHGTRLPSLETALAYELILGASVKDIFAGTAEKLHEAISDRAVSFAKKLGECEPTPLIAQKLETLSNTLLEDTHVIPLCDEYEH